MALAWAGLPALAQAQNAAQEPLPSPVLRSSPMLQERIPEDARALQPAYVSGDSIAGQANVRAVIEGNAELRRSDTIVRANRMEYTVADDRLQAEGQVHINRAGNVFDGSRLDLEVEAFRGNFTDASYQFLATQAHGDASEIQFLDRERSIIHNATYTTCRRDDEASWEPDWMLKARSIHLDQGEEVGYARDAQLQFKGVTLLPIPVVSFPLSDKRKSGLLPPTMGLDNLSGFEYTQPYYWNIAPNRDATLSSTLMSKRGVKLGAEFRYLEPTYQGQLQLDYMPGDRLRDRDRWSYGLQHQAQIASPWGGLGLNLNLNRVSDNDYWRDFTRRGTNRLLNNNRLLASDASLSWAGEDSTLMLRTLKWQTLQDVAAPITPPYDRMPQLQWRYTPLNLGHGLDMSIEADTTRFEGDPRLTRQPDAQRSYLAAEISRPFVSPGAFFTPKLKLHASQYQFDDPLSNGMRSASRTLPTVSLDSGLVFERDTQLFGRKLLQTLEPRAFYTYTPYRSQNMLPVYDTALNDFNLATIYSENSYSGQDRFADNNLLTLGLTTRLIDADTGAESARFGVAQRVRFSDQRVTLPGEVPATDRLSDILFGASINWTPQWALDAAVQYNRETGHSERTTVGARYSPGSYRTISAAYRLLRGTSEQVDVGWQWPIRNPWASEEKGREGGRWYSVGRLNYSLQDRRLVDTVVGFEYDSCCWVGRVVLERLQSSLNTSNTRLLFQVEFVGFTRLSLGSNPLQSLQQNIPRYQALRQTTTVPSRFSNYD
ncbi:LPS-assembly protein LptD [Acidovorax sp. D4N7]|uniref:LPS-assembly protein LptD n=2 Tax=Comamonas endophytica TaxID=2949090 RepID=A0ABY6GG41_9BURK|nr:MULTISPECIES: LPS-assembly protein LptD [unclassified Acidovorax]MCD2512363.1 LPS-assembly protein LptD [Acidovorax sp. D4N7]UYG53290.1 LPS-assembly protein LptD [Acidovorax sp. 5MLIR]